jgi:hypothetical protein
VVVCDPKGVVRKEEGRERPAEKIYMRWRGLARWLPDCLGTMREHVMAISTQSLDQVPKEAAGYLKLHLVGVVGGCLFAVLMSQKTAARMAMRHC